MSFNPKSFYRKMSKMGIKFASGNADMTEFPSVSIHRDQAAVAQEWCEQHFGDGWVWSSPTNTKVTKLYFLSDEDKLLFKLSFATT